MRHIQGRTHLVFTPCAEGTGWYSTGRIYNFRILAMAKCEDGVVRTIRLNQKPDTFFSHPGRTSIKRRAVRGYVTAETKLVDSVAATSDQATVLRFIEYKGDK